MAIFTDTTSSSDSNPQTEENNPVNAPGLQYFVFGLFFIFGGITSLNDVIIPKLKELFTLNYTQAMLVQFCFFTAYAVIGIPGAQLVKKIGYMRGAAFGLMTMMLGCLLFIPASKTAIYGVFLLALFVLASGVVIVQVVANPLISLLGPQKTAHSRLTFAQAFNSLGTTIFPYFGSILILGGIANIDPTKLLPNELVNYRTQETQAIVQGYFGLAIAIAIVAIAVWAFRNKLKNESHETSNFLSGFALLKRPRFGYGALSIFLYVGAEVAIGSLIVNYLMQSHILALDEQSAGKLIPLYWGGALIGRFIGSAILRMFSPGKILATFAIGAICLILISINSKGAVAAYSLLAVGLMNSIMFPTIFTLACEKLGAKAADGSGIINVAIFGGAIIPVIVGSVADISHSLGTALLIPIICYAIIAGFGFYARKPAQ